MPFRTKTLESLTFYVEGLPDDTKESDIENHFKPCCPPGYYIAPGPIINRYAEDGTTIRSRSATVTFFGPKVTGLERISATVPREKLYSSTGKGRISLDKDFYGLNVINEHERPGRDVYFVHGLGGHAFQAWVSETANGGIAAWPRDFLPKRFADEGISASFATLGYNANILDDADKTCTLRTAAQDILERLRLQRRNARPMYFVCHSLGGLVVCQALILALSADPTQSIPQYKDVLRHPITHECLVKGIVFMGTPFNGTLQANQIKPFLELLTKVYPHPVNEKLVGSIQDQAIGLATIRGEFRHIMEANHIKVVVGCETTPIHGTSLLTDRDSAIGALGNVPHLTIHSDHAKMVKFSHPEDQDYRMIEAHLLNMVLGKDPPLSTVSHEQFPIVPNAPERNGGSSQSRNPQRDGGSLHTRNPHGNGESSQSRVRLSIDLTPPDKNPPGVRQSRFLSETRSQTLPQMYGKRKAVFEDDNIDEGIAGLNIINESPTSSNPPSPGLRPIAPTTNSGQTDHTLFSRLSMFDTVIIVDDTGSMQVAADKKSKLSHPPSRWSLLEKGIQYIVQIVTEYDDDGIDVQFLKNSGFLRKNIVKEQSQIVLDLLMKIRPLLETPVCGGGTVFKKELQRAINPRIGKYRAYKDAKDANPNVYVEEPKPLNLLVFTDGEADDAEEVEEYLVKVGKELDLLDAPLRHIGVQFIQVGDDEDARAWLEHLDDDLKKEKGVRDIIDTTPFSDLSNLSPDAFNEILRKILLGAVTKKLDEKKNTQA